MWLLGYFFSVFTDMSLEVDAMSSAPTTPTWTAPRLIELTSVDRSEDGAILSDMEGAGYGPSAPA